MDREKLGTRLGFILLSAGCAIGCGNVWKFPWMTGEYGGGAFVLVYIIFLIILGLPVMTMEFSVGRAAQVSPLHMHKKLEPAGSKWHIHGKFALIGNVVLMMFYTTISGWFVYYFYIFLTGNGQRAGFVDMISNPAINVTCTSIVIVVGFLLISSSLQKGVEDATEVIMVALFILMIGVAIYSLTLDGAMEGLKFYLVPDFSKITIPVVVGAMNQAFFTLSVGMGSMAIFGSYIDKTHALVSESKNVIILDTVVALLAGTIIFPSCFANGYTAENFGGAAEEQVGAGPGLLFETMASVFNNMGAAGRWVGAAFFLFMIFAAMSTVIAVFENIQAMVSEATDWSRQKTALICCVGMLVLALPCELGFNLLSGFQPLGEGSAVLDLEDFIVSSCLLPLGSLAFVLFCTSKKGWGFKNFMEEANTGVGLKVKPWMRGYMTYVLPLIIFIVFALGILTTFGIVTL
ncbi:MAG: sodium-dependent transporter [Clostridia bacterium]|nr:sodium-dependent transporter [Clostridia bacterium]